MLGGSKLKKATSDVWWLSALALWMSARKRIDCGGGTSVLGRPCHFEDAKMPERHVLRSHGKHPNCLIARSLRAPPFRTATGER